MSVAARLFHRFGPLPLRSPAYAPPAPGSRKADSAEPGAATATAARIESSSAAEPELDLPEASGTSDVAGQPGFIDLEAAVELVASGLATHVVLSGFPSWPGLLWKAQELAREAGVSIVPRIPRGDGRVDLEVTGDRSSGD